MKKKILFMIINMNIGGTEKALLNMLSEIDKEKYDVTILMLEEYGGFLNDIPEWVNIKYLENYNEIKSILNNPLHITAIEYFKNKKIFKSLKMVYLYLLCKAKKEQSALFKYLLKDTNYISEEYDLAIAYAGPMDFISYFVINKINAKKKVQWIHFDVTKIGFNINFASNIYIKFDKVFVVSKEGKLKLDNLLSVIKYKTEVFSNIVSPKTIRKMADEGIGFNDEFDGIRILTVGRLSKEKGQDMTIPVLARLKSEGYDVRWYCIGEGSLRSECEQYTKKYKVENDFVLLGINSNPYPFMKQCDIYVQPSRYEGYCTTTVEAKCLYKISIVTNVNGMNEQFRNGKTGLISECNSDSLYENIKVLLDDKNLRENIKFNLLKEDINTDMEISKLYKLIN